MEIEEQLRQTLQRVNSGDFDDLAADLDGTDFAIYVPAYAEGAAVKLMPEGLSQLESNLKITYKKKLLGTPVEGKPVAWIGNKLGKDSKCRHYGTETCRHCTEHAGGCKHCTDHGAKFEPGVNINAVNPLDAPEMDYDEVVKSVDAKVHVLDKLAKHGMGLALVHGHSDKYQFTHLPVGKVSVIVDGETTFRNLEDVQNDPEFVPNMWRLVDGVLTPVGGYSAR